MMKRNIFPMIQPAYFLLLIFSLLIIVGCGTIKLGWNPNTESDLAGYRVYYGTTSGTYDNSIDAGMGTLSGGFVTYSLTNLSKGQSYCIAVTAYNTSNYQSGFSNEVCGVAE